MTYTPLPSPAAGNGDINSYTEWNAHMPPGGGGALATCMIARGALIKPWVFTGEGFRGYRGSGVRDEGVQGFRGALIKPWVFTGGGVRGAGGRGYRPEVRGSGAHTRYRGSEGTMSQGFKCTGAARGKGFRSTYGVQGVRGYKGSGV